MGLFKDFINQTRKPEGFLGKLMVNGMNSGHAKLADWGMSALDGVSADCIAELGCGGGMVVEEGSPEELLTRENSVFRRMTQLQSASAGWSVK